MRRLAASALLVLVLAGGAFAALAGGSAEGSSGYRIDAIFDSTKGIIPGNVVEIAGAKVGSVSAVQLTKGYKARVEMTIDGRFAPFRTDARCQIRPVALIGEMEVNCDPGTIGRPLVGSGGHAPTVPLDRTSVPVDFTDLFNIWTAPATQRLSVILWTLGAGVSGRGGDLNAVLQRSNPTLALARQTITTLNAQRVQLSSLVDSTDGLLRVLAPQRMVVQSFLGEAARVTSLTAQHSGSLGESVRRLPALLAAAQPALQQVDVVAANTTPVLGDLRAAAPDVTRLVGDVVPLAQVARPALTRLGAAAAAASAELPKLTPVISQLRSFAHASRPVARLLNLLFTSLRDRGFVEGLSGIPYYLGSSVSRFDNTSHVVAGEFLASGCAGTQITQLAACSAKFHPTAGMSGQAHHGLVHHTIAPRVPPGSAVIRPATGTAPAPTGSATPSPTPSGSAPPPTPRAPVVGGVIEAVGKLLQSLPLIGAPPPTGSSRSLQSLLNYLVK